MPELIDIARQIAKIKNLMVVDSWYVDNGISTVMIGTKGEQFRIDIKKEKGGN